MWPLNPRESSNSNRNTFWGIFNLEVSKHVREQQNDEFQNMKDNFDLSQTY